MANKTIIKNTTMLYVMNIAKIVFPLITLPYLTRVLTVDAYGLVAFVKAVMQYLQIIIGFGFMYSGTRDIVNNKYNNERLSLETSTIFWAKIILGIITFFIFFVLSFFIPLLRENIVFSFLSFLVVFLTCFLFDYLFMGLEEMQVITYRFLLMRGIAVALTFVFVKNDSDLLWIPILDLIGSIFAILLIIFELRSRNIKISFTSWAHIKQKIKVSFVFFLSDVATTILLAINTVVIGIILDKKDVAFWSVCMQLVAAVLSLYNPIANGIYPHMVKTPSIKIINKCLVYFMPIVIIGCVFTYFIAPYALELVGGVQYVDATIVLRFLIPVMLFGFPSVLFGWPVLGAINKEKENTRATIITALIQLGGLAILILSNSFSLITVAILRGMTEFILFGIRYYYYLRFKSSFETVGD